MCARCAFASVFISNTEIIFLHYMFMPSLSPALPLFFSNVIDYTLLGRTGKML